MEKRDPTQTLTPDMFPGWKSPEERERNIDQLLAGYAAAFWRSYTEGISDAEAQMVVSRLNFLNEWCRDARRALGANHPKMLGRSPAPDSDTCELEIGSVSDEQPN